MIQILTTNFKLYIHNTHGKDMRQYNQPTAPEVATIILDDEEIPKERDIVVHRKEGKLEHMSELHGTYDPLQYPLLFPYGEYGWHEPILRANESSDPEDIDPMDIDEGESSRHTGATQDMENLFLELFSKSSKSKGKGKAIETEAETEQDNDDNDDKSESDKDNDDIEEGQPIIKKRKWVTIREFVVYHLQIRNSIKTTSTLHLSGRLFQQYLVDQYAKWESNNLRWQRENQQELRYETVSGLQDIVSYQDADANRIGKRIILSSSFTGLVRYMQQLYQDSMVIVREFGKPSLFVTVTCNPNLPEITNELLPNQQLNDRPDLVARVFKLKLKSITNDLFVKGIFEKVIFHIHVIEFQKRGLPHVHILIILVSKDRSNSLKDFDNLVCAEISDQEQYSQLYEIVSKSMIHGPCGHLNPNSLCMINGKYSKNYPRDFVEQTIINKYEYPLYRKRNNKK